MKNDKKQPITEGRISSESMASSEEPGFTGGGSRHQVTTLANINKHDSYENHAKTVAFFDQLAEKWDMAEQDPVDTVRRVEEIGDLLNFRRGDDLLEVGCGTGQLTAWLAEQVSPGRVTSVDFSQKMLDIAKTKCENVEFRLMDICRDQLDLARYDVAFCFHCVPHFHDMLAAIRNLARSLKPQGRLLVLHLSSRADINAFHDRVGGAVAGHHLPDERCWEDLLADSVLEKTMLADGRGLYLLEAKRISN